MQYLTHCYLTIPLRALSSSLTKVTPTIQPVKSCQILTQGQYSKHFSTKPKFDNDPSAYRSLRSTMDAKLKSRLNRQQRFQSIREREDRCDMPVEMCKANSVGRYMTIYRGCNLICSPEDYVLYHQLLWYVRPHTLIELGTCEGGSAVWFADQLKLLNIPGHVYSMDIDSSLLSEAVKKLNPDNVTFLQGDCNEIEKTFTPELLTKLPHPWVVIDDSHVNLDGTLSYFHQYLKEGDYLVVEDTNPYIPLNVAPIASVLDSCPLLGPEKLEALKAFLHKYDEYYAVDSFLTDFFGYNCSWMWHGFVRRMKT